jgi:uncharacterized membrane protein HdeD (DUF308 family)
MSKDAFGEVKSRSGWAIVMGVVTAALGVFLVLYPFITATLTTIVLGWTLVFVGAAHFVFALKSGSAGQFFWKILSGLLYGAVGIMLVSMPLRGVAALTGLLGGLFVAQGVFQMIAAFKARPVAGWGWVLFDGIWSLLLGLLILAQWPASSVWAIGTLVGASVFVNGVSRIMVAGKVRGVATRVDQLAHGNV